MKSPRFQFAHNEFKLYVKNFYTGVKINDIYIESCVKHIASGLPASTNQFIIICNEMDVSPKEFFIENY